jgi:hypothetical protein
MSARLMGPAADVVPVQRALLAAGVVAFPGLALAMVARLSGSLGAFQFELAVVTWLLAGAVWLLAAAFAREGGADCGLGLRPFAAPLVVLGLVPLLAMPAFGGVVAPAAVSSQEFGHDVWTVLLVLALLLSAVALWRPQRLPRPLATGVGLALAGAAAAYALAPALPPFFTTQGPTWVYTLAFSVTAAGSLVIAAALWRRWLQGGPATPAWLAAGYTVLAYALLGFLLQGGSAEIGAGWFGRMATLAAAFLFALAPLAPLAPVEAVGAHSPAALPPKG